ncbi:homoserine dehydrogenase [Pyrococcus furiosus DSM 3638]|uniref:Homoserine dehydrogenase n=3 Tax=Pyrococcus furiosus TaxID=2261 RepID=A0A5C0XSD3_PYRFU|nr:MULTISPECIES: homoserine dehydrogenase [Pyrococcus]AAL81228.1 homoserine dehydrogenase [Pyrococcus furiosus DSM 3638]AFN03896.1 homoserine dehydrogenase [Pyrococcus furiosus COM1]MDK2868774.1 homoserine dehydrogenase [Pyrococcus sp.]QEK79699.1 homoserine dehydrogenase [Pyrococcus furiosus DSM 3638]
MKEVKISIFGFGTVGRALAEIVAENSEVYGIKLKVVSITDRSGTLWGDFDLLEAKEVKEATGKISNIGDYEVYYLKPEEIIEEIRPDIFVDVSSWDDAARVYEFALKEGVSVVTSNKPPIAESYDKLLKASQEGNAGLFFEATVMAGTPIIGLLRENLLGEKIEEIKAVVNASTTFILTRMEQGKTFEEAFNEAKSLGVLEEDPSKDIDGIDAFYKAKILHWVSYGAPPEFEERVGIREVKDARNVRLVAQVSEGRISVKPIKLPENSPLLVEGVQNAAIIKTDNLGEVVLKGPGGGGRVTASGVFTDIIKAALRFPKAR